MCLSRFGKAFVQSDTAIRKQKAGGWVAMSGWRLAHQPFSVPRVRAVSK